tara:strand:- start:394 stop:597 length:204 start_codon:yes stop_codon:yes gene_type:complete
MAFYDPDSKKPMTKAEAIKLFRFIYKTRGYRRGGDVAKRTEWNDYTDALCKDGLITSKQYDTWDQPF